METSVARPQKNGDSHYRGSRGPDCYFLPLLTSDGRRIKARISPESRQRGIDCRCQIVRFVCLAFIKVTEENVLAAFRCNYHHVKQINVHLKR